MEKHNKIILNNENQGQKFSSEDLKNNLIKLLEENKITLNQLHKNTGVSLTTIKRIKYDKEINPTINSLLPIAEFFAITLNQLIELEPLPQERVHGAYIEKRDFWTKLPIITWENAVDWPQIKDSLMIERYTVTDIEVSIDSFALIVEETNWDIFPVGSKLIFDANKNPKHCNYVLVSCSDSHVASFYQLLIYDGTYYLKPPYANYQTVIYDKSKYNFRGTLIQARIEQD